MRPKWLTRLGSSPVAAPESLLGTPAATPFWRYSHPDGILPKPSRRYFPICTPFWLSTDVCRGHVTIRYRSFNCHTLLQCTRCPSGLSPCFPGPLATPECTPGQGTPPQKKGAKRRAPNKHEAPPQKKQFCCFSISPCRFTISTIATMAAAARTRHHRGMQIFATVCMPPVAAQGSPSFSTERTS